MAAFDAYLRMLFRADKLNPESSWAPWQGTRQGIVGSAMPHYDPAQVWDFNDRLLSNDKTGTKRSY